MYTRHSYTISAFLLLLAVGTAQADTITIRYKGVILTGASVGASVEGVVKFPRNRTDLIAGGLEDWWEAPDVAQFSLVGAGINFSTLTGESSLRIKDTPVEDALRYDGVSGSAPLLLLLSGGGIDSLLVGTGGLTGFVPTGLVIDPTSFEPCGPQLGGGGFGGSCSQFATSQAAFLFQLTEFSIAPIYPKELLSQLVADVVALNLRAGISNSFDAKLGAVMAALDDDQNQNSPAAINAMYAFINAVNAQRRTHLNDPQADLLISSAEAVIDALNVTR